MMVMEGALKRSDIVDIVCQKTYLPRKEAEVIVMSMMEYIKEALLQGETVKIAGFGVFSITERKETVGRNVKAGYIVKIPSRRVVVFKPSDKLKKRVEVSLGSF